VLVVSGPTGGHEHDGEGHPEQPARIAAAMAGVDDLHLGTDLRIVAPRVADLTELTRVHDIGYLEELAAFCEAGGGQLDPDTFAAADSWLAARQAAGAGLAAVDALRDGKGDVAFVAARPPGHHALPDRAMGFCLLNNVAVSAAALASEGERVLVVDWDVHHGNGTQAMFWEEPNVLYVSTHQSPLFPGTGQAREIGGSGARGLTVNIPLPAKATGDIVRQAMEEVALPVIDEFAPSWVLVSAGFDGHRADPLADLALSSGDFAELARMTAALANRSGRLVLFLEGGYDLSALRMSVATTLGTLVGGIYEPEGPTFGGPGSELVELARHQRREALRLAAEESVGEGRFR
jgi:acetoin utilization deacetylase AcuC-like enzyme